MLVVKLVRKGKKNLPSFRVAVTERNKVIEFLGSYYPYSKSPRFAVSKEHLERWLKSGAKLTPAVEGLMKGKYEFKRYVPRKTEIESPEPVIEKPGQAEEAPTEPPTSEEEVLGKNA
uniref:30S ribosomal protein S16 n=1 Tax=candidate division WWE3 bacterium TaxID=2053526 RepID=A0A832DRP0_UNCKA